MAESHVISALTSKRAELAGIIQHHQKEISRLSEEVKTLDAAIKLFEPDYRIQGIKPKQYRRKNHFFEHGEAHTLVLDIVRQYQPISTESVAIEAAKRKGFDRSSDAFSDFKSSIWATLRRQRKLELIADDHKEKGVSFWTITS